ncbi:MAG: hypothetical protein FJX37_11410, partial [Alphaproteobacteria bacterium]|nr:hypothetical protein [Alphaproteobacteria bacterium]
VSWWRGEGDGRDSFGSNHGALQGSVAFAPGKVGQAFSFNGAGFVEVPDSPSLNFGASKTMSVDLWAYRMGSDGIMHFLGKRVGCGQTHYQMVFDPVRGLHFGVKEAHVGSGIQMPLNAWTHLAATVNGQTLKFYINGELKGTSTSGLGGENAAPLRIGRSGTCEYFQGLIDEIALYNRALSDAEIRALYETGAQGLARSVPPQITVQPANQTVDAGRAVTFSAAATGTPPFSYQWYFNGTNAMAGATNQNLNLTGVQSAQAGRYSVEVRNCAGAIRSQEAELRVNRVNLPPQVALTNPFHRALFAPGVDIIISASAIDPDGTVDQVLFYAGSTLLGASAKRPFSVTWRAVPVGDYVLTARAVDNDGASNASTPVKIAVSEDACVASPVALIPAAADPDVETIQDYLFEMGLSAQVFDLGELNADVLKTYPLIFWADLGAARSRITEREVDLLDQLHRIHERTLYFVGERLAGALTGSTGLREPQRSRWRDLIHLEAPSGQQTGGIVTIEGAEQTDPLHLGRFGTLGNFEMTNTIEVAGRVMDESALLGRVGASAVLAAYPSWDKLDSNEAR